MQCDHCPYRRVILVQVVQPGGKRASGSNLLSIESVRVPVEAIDLDTRTGQIVKVMEVEQATAWKGVPTPGI